MGLSTFLRGETQTQLRGLQWLSLTDTGVLLTGTVVDDGGGGSSVTWANGGTVACRIDPLTKRALDRLTGGAIDERSTHVVTTPYGTSINARDRFAISGRGTYEVTGVRERTGQATQVFEVLRLQ